MTKKQKSMLYAHINATDVTLDTLYKKCSQAKQDAAKYCEMEYDEKHGYNKRYHSANCFRFSFSFKFRQGREEFLQYMTSDHTYIFKIADIDDHGNAIPCM